MQQQGARRPMMSPPIARITSEWENYFKKEFETMFTTTVAETLNTLLGSSRGPLGLGRGDRGC